MHPPIFKGTRVKTIEENIALRHEWTEEAKLAKKWGVKGIVDIHHDSHGLCYDIIHEDGTEACYDPSEFEILQSEIINMNKENTRPEDGPMMFGEDWCGTFFRGDSASYYAFELTNFINDMEKYNNESWGAIRLNTLKCLADTLGSCDMSLDSYSEDKVQMMKNYKECVEKE